MKTYSIGEAAKLLGLTVSTLRYYDKEGLLENVERTEGGIRIFKDSDIQNLKMLECLKSTGMPLKDIKTFFRWCKEGDASIEQRYQMFLERKAILTEQMRQLKETLEMVDYKCGYYRIAKEEGTLDTPRLKELEQLAVKESEYIKNILGS